MIYKWFSVAFQESPQSDQPWVVLRNTFSEFNGVLNHTVHSRHATRPEAIQECDIAEELH
jgi:hypothetical protein